MSNPGSPRGLERNVRLYPWYAASFSAYFWLPVFFLYFSERLTLENVLLLEAIYYFSVVVLELPSGYLSDAVGRRLTLLISSIALVIAYALFIAASDFAVLAAAQVCMAVGIAFNSGTDTSFHYDSLAALGREEEFAEREARVARNAFLAGAGAALLGGAVAVVDLRLAYGLALVAAVITVGIVASLVEPTTRGDPTVLGRGFLGQLRSCAAYLRHPSLRWLLGFAVLMTILNHVPYEFYQPYVALLTADLEMPERAPLVTGVHTALTMLIAAAIASQSIRIRDRLGTRVTLLLCTVVQIAIIGAMGLVAHPAIVILILLRTVPRALMTAPLNAAITPQVAQPHRATYLSLQSLAGRLSFSAFLLALTTLAGAHDAADWPHLSLMLRVATGFGVGALALLVLSMRWSPAEEGAEV